MHPARSQSKWYGFVSDQQKIEAGTGKFVSSWSTDASKVNSTYSPIARAAGIASTPPASRQISDNLRRWEKSAREASTICKQAARFNRFLYKVQENMQSQLRVIRTELSKGKSSAKVSTAADKLQFLMDFSSSITQAMAKTLEHLSDFVFVSVANTTLARFKVVSIPMNVQTNRQIPGNQTNQPGRILGIVGRIRKSRAKPRTILQDQPGANSHINDNYCVNMLQDRLLARNHDPKQGQTIDTVKFHIVKLKILF